MCDYVWLTQIRHLSRLFLELSFCFCKKLKTCHFCFKFFFYKILVFLENNLNTVTEIAFTSVITNFPSYEFCKLPEPNPTPTQKKLFSEDVEG